MAAAGRAVAAAGGGSGGKRRVVAGVAAAGVAAAGLAAVGVAGAGVAGAGVAVWRLRCCYCAWLEGVGGTSKGGLGKDGGDMARKSQSMLAAAAWPERCDSHRAVKVQAAGSAGVACGWAQEVPGAGGPLGWQWRQRRWRRWRWWRD